MKKFFISNKGCSGMFDEMKPPGLPRCSGHNAIRPRLIQIWLVIFAGLSAASSFGAPQNILLLIADDYGVDSSSLYNSTNNGAQLPPTPNLALLASNGVVFTKAYANPVCSPTRACLLTGQFSFRTGVGDVIDNGTSLGTNLFSLPRMFATNSALGYQVAQFGKWHLATGPNSPRNVGGWTNFSGSIPGALVSYTNWTKVINGTQFFNYTNYATLDVMQDATNWIGSRGTNPWFAWVAFNAPHTPLHLPPTNMCPHYANLSGTSADITAHPANYFDAMVEAEDTAIGKIMSYVNLTNTHVIFLGDNGTVNEVIQPPFPNTRGKNTLYEGGIHVPLVIAGPAVANPNRTNATPANMVDVYATILEMAGINSAATIPTNNPIDGQSLLPVLQTNNLTLPRYGFSEQFGTNNPTAANAGRTLANTRYKLIDFTAKADEFYDLAVDPYEATNLLATAMNATQLANYYSLVMKLGDYQIALAAPVITGFAKTNAQFSVNVQRNLTNIYGLWRASTLDGLNWSPLTNALVVTNGASSVTLTDTNAAAAQNFYRVIAQ
jgi:arylsulfatase A-like enzyme